VSAPPARPSPTFEARERTNPGLALEVPEALVEAVAQRVADLLVERLPAQRGPEPWLDVDAAADYLACRPHRVYDIVAEGRLRCAKDGRRSLFRREWLDAYLLGEEGA